MKWLRSAVCIALLLPTVAVADEDAQPSDAASAIKNVYSQLCNQIKAGDFKAASKVMTKEAAEELLAGYFLLAADIADADDTSDVARKFTEKCKELDKQFGLRAALPEQYYSDEGMSWEEYDAVMKKAYDQLNKAVSAKGDRLEVAKAIHDALMTMPKDQAWHYVDHPFYENGKLSNPRKVDGGISLAVDLGWDTVFLTFSKSTDGWKWSGYDPDRDTEDGGFPLIEDIAIVGKTVSGDSISLEDYRGKVVLVDFWGTWCAPCVAEFPKLKKIYERLHSKGFEIVGVAADDAETLEDFVKDTPLPWKNIVDGEGAITGRLRVSQFPTTLLIDQQGNHYKSDLHAAALLEEVIDKLELDPDDFEALRTELHGGHHGDAEGPADAPETAEEGEAELEIGFGAADGDSDNQVTRKEMKRYLQTRLNDSSLPYQKIFDRLDADNDGILTIPEFDKRHAAIEHFMGDDYFAGEADPLDPGIGYQPVAGLNQAFDDRAIYGAAFHRYREASRSPDIEWKYFELETLPNVAPSELGRRLALQPGGSPATDDAREKIGRLMQATVIIAGGGDAFFTAGAIMISDDGYALTNYHVAEAMSDSTLIAITSDGAWHPVMEYVAGDRDRDTALVRLKGRDFAHVPLAKETPHVGDDIVLIHHSERRFYTYDRGYVMRHPQVGDHPWMEISMDYAPGGSGCGIFNASGELVGLVSTIQYGDGPVLGEPVNWEEVDWDTESVDGSAILMVKHAVSLPALRAILGVGDEAPTRETRQQAALR